MTEAAPVQFDLPDREAWLIRLRWLGISGVAVTVAVTIFAGWVDESLGLFCVVVAMALYNQGFSSWLARRGTVDAEARGRSFMLQILVDLAALTVLLHLSGGAENPFWVFFVFHMAIASMLLMLREVLVLAGAAVFMHGGSVVAEHFGLLPHHHLLFGASSPQAGVLLHSSGFPALMVGHLFAFTAMIFGTVFFVYSVEAERRAATRTAMAKDRALNANKRMARIGELSAGVAHTIRNPLHGVSNCVELLRSELGAEDEASAELLELADEGLSRIERVTRRLLALTRDPDMQPITTELGSLLEDALKLAARTAEEAGVELSMRLDEEVHAKVDPDRFVEAILNLVDNAVAACSEGDRVEVILTGEAEGRVRIWVRDTGPGMDPAICERAFTPFFTTKAIGEGTGLGLAITRSVIEALGGEIELDSTLGRGTTFSIQLPRSTTHE